MSKPQLRSSQIITTFGPGAMVDLPDDSVIIAGLAHWSYDLSSIPVIDENRLVEKLRRVLGVSNLTLRAPPPAADQIQGKKTPDVTAWRFPEWFIVQKTEITPRGHRSRRLVHQLSIDKGRFRDADGKRQNVVPVRFVRACPKGHVGDIDWKGFVHGSQIGCPRDLHLEERGTSGDLREVWVRCDCGAQRPMSDAATLQFRALGGCTGSRPWLGPTTAERCDEPSRLLIRSASNAYFPQLMSVISIPDAHLEIDGIVRSLWDDFLSMVETEEDLAKERKRATVKARLEGYTDAKVFDAVKRVREGAGPDRPVKEAEFDVLAEAKDELGSDTPDGDFFARTLPKKHWNFPWMDPIERVVLVHRLREVVAQVGFTRFEAAGPDIQGELALDVKRAPLDLDLSWVPAVENRGEGVFLQLRKDAIEGWLNRDAVAERGKILLAGFDLWKREHPGSSRVFPGLPYYLLHSLSHLLLTAISLECGYPASSLRERVYATPDRYGILIYTGSSDAEGTLGGLVEAGRVIARHVQRALERGRLCSNDPICAYHTPVSHDHQPLLGAACHGCLLVAETSCEQHNDFLDRTLVVGTVEATGAEFFSSAQADSIA